LKFYAFRYIILKDTQDIMSKKLRLKNNKSSFKINLEDNTRREILAICLLTLAVISLLAYFNLAASAGRFIDLALQKIFGVLRPLFILTIFTLGFLLATRRTKGVTIFGIILLLFSLLALVHLIKFPGQAGFKAAENGLAGGFAGLYLAYPLFQIFGFWASLVILLAFLFIALSLLFPNLTTQLLSSGQLIFVFFKKIITLFSRLRWRIFKPRYPPLQSLENKPTLTIHSIESFPEPSAASVSPEISQEETGNTLTKSPQSEFGTNYKKRPRLPKIDLPFDLLEKNGAKPTAGDIRTRSAIIQKTLKNFGIEVEMGEVSIGPTVTQYTLRPAEGIKLSSITALHNDLALALAAHPIRIEAPIPGKSLVGIEVPNEKVAVVRLREVLESEEFFRRQTNLMIALGKDVAGKPWLADLSRMPHLLVAGATGSGKTVCLNSIIISLLYQNGPSDLKFILIDPKRVELPIYNDIPHLLTPVVTEVKKTIQVLRWLIFEMEKRFETLEQKGARDIKSYNEKVAPDERMPYLVVIVDELADLMSAAASEIEGLIIRLAQMARAVGIHLVLATQRPSVDVITGLIKANITSRIAFSVASTIDSRTILDTAGAEKLLGRGDMLFLTSELGKPKRLQGAFVSEEEIRRVVEYLKTRGEPDYLEINLPSDQLGLNFNDDISRETDPLLPEAKQIILQAGKASASLLQRRLAIGYARAARILDLLEAEGFIGPADGAKPREILKGSNQPPVVLSSEKMDDKID
jgi:S-DNA-T family DNA segregation ATPase FtsK/SpoIIIE